MASSEQQRVLGQLGYNRSNEQFKGLSDHGIRMLDVFESNQSDSLQSIVVMLETFNNERAVIICHKKPNKEHHGSEESGLKVFGHRSTLSRVVISEKSEKDLMSAIEENEQLVAPAIKVMESANMQENGNIQVDGGSFQIIGKDINSKPELLQAIGFLFSNNDKEPFHKGPFHDVILLPEIGRSEIESNMILGGAAFLFNENVEDLQIASAVVTDVLESHKDELLNRFEVENLSDITAVFMVHAALLTHLIRGKGRDESYKLIGKELREDLEIRVQKYLEQQVAAKYTYAV